ncbi:hypothetical protein Misp01_55150 [Microtetraspora sp. NBRC 13810]|uniref:hypothetical protein n=1 Tax=Microtetraspora sp. NBRC 13810 TaxID=3030990 RepID=UPI0024A37A4B|nr:hypothetical protein [Microtetraspora sp. NBRC 13810]GLW10387.1 hypothetical protein Misp01_55150 [Microtetraspora sp. NBRC 13810]
MNASSKSRRSGRKTVTTLAAAAVCLGLGLTGAVAASAEAQPPGLDRLHAYCQHKGHLNSVATNPRSVWSWRCIGHRGEHHGIDMNDACRWHTNGRLTRASFHNERDAFSWYCY